MDFSIISKLLLAVMFSPPGIANFIICTLLKKRLHASIAAFVAASAFMFLNQSAFSQQTVGNYTAAVVVAVIAMMITSHLAYTIGEKIIRKNKS